jgi:phage terminase small subunit
MKYRTCTLQHLPGVKAIFTPARWVKSGKQAIAAIRAGYAATDAHDDGAMNVWRDDDGKYRAHSLHYMKVLEETRFDTIKEAAVWVDQWMEAQKELA